MGELVQNVVSRLSLAVGYHASHRFTRTHFRNLAKAPIVTTSDS